MTMKTGMMMLLEMRPLLVSVSKVKIVTFLTRFRTGKEEEEKEKVQEEKARAVGSTTNRLVEILPGWYLS